MRSFGSLPLRVPSAFVAGLLMCAVCCAAAAEGLPASAPATAPAAAPATAPATDSVSFTADDPVVLFRQRRRRRVVVHGRPSRFQVSRFWRFHSAGALTRINWGVTDGVGREDYDLFERDKWPAENLNFAP